MRYFVILIVCFFCSMAHAADYALAMHGDPKYPANFRHFDYADPNAVKGGRLRRAEVGTFDNLNPYLITGRVTAGLQEALLLTYDSLMARAWNEPFTMYGLVAKTVLVPPARNWIEFHLDPDARFHDGHPITTKDVAFSHHALMTYGRPNQRRIYKLVKKITVKDPRTIRFDLGPGFDRETVMILANMPVLPAHYWRGKEFGKTTLRTPLSSGPYRISEIQPGREIVFNRVKDYWAKDKPVTKGLYNFDNLQFDFYRDDHAALQALAAGQADMRREWSAISWKRDYQFNAIKEKHVIKKVFENGRPMRARFFIYNMRRPPFDDIRVREALAYAFDFEWVNKNLFMGTQNRLDSIFMNSELAYQGADKFVPPRTDGSGIAGLRPNLRHALMLLDQAGWHLHDGVLIHDPSGKAMAFEILLNDPADEKLALEFSRTLQRIGVTAHIRVVDTAQYIGRISQFDFDMTLNLWRNSLSPGTEQAVYWGSGAANQPGSFNYSGLKSHDVDRFVVQLTNAKTRPGLVAAARKLDRAVMAQWIGIPLFDAPEDRVAYRRDIRMPTISPLYGPVIESWWYNPEKSGKEEKKDSPSPLDAIP